jgi:hypothetical protein
MPQLILFFVTILIILALKLMQVRIEYLRGNKLVLFYTNFRNERKEIIITQI